MMTLKDATDILRAQKFKTIRPTDAKMLPKYMQGWSEEKIAGYYGQQQKISQALELAITALNSIDKLKKASYDLVDIFKHIDI